MGFALIGVCVADTMQAEPLPLLVVKAGRAGFIDANGRLLAAPRYARCGRWNEGRLWVQEDAGPDSLGTFLDEQATPVSPMQFRDLSAVIPELPIPEFEKGVAVVGMSEGGFGYLNAQGKVLGMTTQAGAFQRQDSELLICVVNDRVGFIDRTGKIVIQAQYEDATPFRGGRAGVRQGADWGLIDEAGDWVVKPAFESLRSASDDGRIWAYEENGQLGLIDQAGKRLTGALYLNVGALSGSAIAVQRVAGWGLVSEAGTELIKPFYANLWPFGAEPDLWAAQSSAGKWGVVDTKGHERVPCRYDFVTAVLPDVWLAQQSGLWGILDPTTGRWRAPAVFNRILSLEPPLETMLLVEQGSQWGVVDSRTGKVLQEARYRRIEQWGEFLAIADGQEMKLLDVDQKEVLVWKGTFEGLPEHDTLTGGSGVLVTERGSTRITSDGKLPWNDFFDDASAWSDGLLAVKQKNQWGLVNEEVKWVIDPKFESVGMFTEGVVPVRDDGRWRLLRLNGNITNRLFAIEAEELGRAWRGLVPVMRKGRWGLIDFDGKDVLPCDYDTLEWGLDEVNNSRYYDVEPVWIPGLEAYGR